MRVLPLTVAVVAVAVGFWDGALASHIRHFSLAQLGREAQLIVVGELVAADSFWDESHETIYTDYLLAVERTAKGCRRDFVTVRLMGGTIDGKTLTVHGNPSLAVGERVVLALRDQGDFATLVGMAQGKWTVVARQERLVVRRQSGGAAEGGGPDLDLDELLRRMGAGGRDANED